VTSVDVLKLETENRDSFCGSKRDYSERLTFQRDEHSLVQSVTLHKQPAFDTARKWNTSRRGASNHKLFYSLLTSIPVHCHVDRKSRCSG